MIGRDAIPKRFLHRMEDHHEAFEVWRRRGVRGRTLVHFDGHMDLNWVDLGGQAGELPAENTETGRALVAASPSWIVSNAQQANRLSIGNFIGPAIDAGMVSTFYWVVPDPFWRNAKAREALRREVADVLTVSPKACGPLIETSQFLTSYIGACPLIICTLRHLPAIQEPVLLDIDVDHFVTRRADDIPPYYAPRTVRPWTTLPRFLRELGSKRLLSDCVTICDSVNEGYTPLGIKFWGDSLCAFFESPHRAVRTKPKPGSAAASYAVFERAYKRKNDILAKRLWSQMVGRDSSYRTLYATPALRLERDSSRFANAEREYRRLVQIDPAWHVAWFGLGRVLWDQGKIEAAEDAFSQAVRLSPGRTFAAFWMGRCAEAKGDFRGAERWWKRARREYPDHPFVPQALAGLTPRPSTARARVPAGQSG
jgi:hypothetical protein